jgi:hypothetical protein
MAKNRSIPRLRSSENVPIVSGSARFFLALAREHQLAEKKARREAKNAPPGWIHEGFKGLANFHGRQKKAMVEAIRQDLRSHNPSLRSNKRKR